MSLNPVNFGKSVVDQFGRYILSTFPVADSELEAQIRERVTHDVGGARLLSKGPYVFLNRPFEEGPGIDELLADTQLGLHSETACLLSRFRKVADKTPDEVICGNGMPVEPLPQSSR